VGVVLVADQGPDLTLRLRALAATAAVACVAAVAAPAPASAAVQCSLVLPTKVVVGSATERISYRLSSNCSAAQADQASWHVLHTSGGHDWWAELGGEASDGVELFPATAPSGTYRAYPAGAEQADGDPLTQNSPTLAVKYGARVSLSGRYTSTTHPLGFTMTELSLTATAGIWSPARSGWVPRAGTQVQLLRHKGGDWWVWERNGTTNSQGKVTFTRPSYSSATYRVRIVETTKAWASGSGNFRATPQ
jgi:hypothetical protein